MDSNSGQPERALKVAAGSAAQARWAMTAWAALAGVALLSLAPIPGNPQAPTHTDKLVHVALYATLMFCHARAYPPARWLLVAAGLATYGAGLELLQQLVPPRGASLADALANCAGVSIMLMALTRRRQPVE